MTVSVAGLKIMLDDVEPPVMRRIAVPLTNRLDRLHLAFQAALGWTDSHLYAFRFGNVAFGVPDPEWGGGPLDARKTARARPPLESRENLRSIKPSRHPPDAYILCLVEGVSRSRQAPPGELYDAGSDHRRGRPKAMPAGHNDLRRDAATWKEVVPSGRSTCGCLKKQDRGWG